MGDISSSSGATKWPTRTSAEAEAEAATSAHPFNRNTEKPAQRFWGYFLRGCGG